jgi:NNP family nitrate/nitrite transporter-like MFS transporter
MTTALALKGGPRQSLWGATLGFFIGFAAVALFGPTAARFQETMQLGPMAVGFLVAMPALSGSLLRIPAAALVDTRGGRVPMLVLLGLSIVGMLGITAVVTFLYPARLTASYYPLLLLLALLCGCAIATFSVGAAQVAYWFPQQRQGRALAVFAGVGNLAPGIFSFVLPFALAAWGLAGSYVAWSILLAAGTVAYASIGRDAWYFQYRAAGVADADAREAARLAGQALFPAGGVRDSLRLSARSWRTWALVAIYFTTFGGFIGLTAWLPTYWHAFFDVNLVGAGMLAAAFSLTASLVRIVGGVMADQLREGGENTAILALFIMLAGALVMVNAQQFELAFAVSDLGRPGYAIGFIVFIFLVLVSLSATWVLKYSGAPALTGVGPSARRPELT